MTETLRPFARASLAQSALILLAAAVAALSVNALRSDGIALIPAPNPDHAVVLATGERIDIAFADARRAWESGNAVFLDARPFSQYEDGHLPGAIAFPWLEFDRYVERVLPELPEDRMLVTYCDGVTCDLSKELAKALREFGFPETHVLVNGWTVWREAGLPVESGAGG